MLCYRDNIFVKKFDKLGVELLSKLLRHQLIALAFNQRQNELKTLCCCVQFQYTVHGFVYNWGLLWSNFYPELEKTI